MKRTVSLKLELTPDQPEHLDRLQAAFSAACNLIVPVAAQDKCSNRVKLHYAGYSKIRETSPQLGSQMAYTPCTRCPKPIKRFWSTGQTQKRGLAADQIGLQLVRPL